MVVKTFILYISRKAAEKLRPFSTATNTGADEALLQIDEQFSYLLQFRFKFSGVVAANASVPKLRMK
eukprot:s3075_g7.t1